MDLNKRVSLPTVSLYCRSLVRLDEQVKLIPKWINLALSPFRQDPMRGAYKHWAVNGAKRLGQQAVYFAVPFGLGTHPTSPIETS